MTTLVKRILNGENVRDVLEGSDSHYKKYKAHYIVSSERSNRRSDEDHVDLYSDRILDAGDSFEMDGLTWYVDEVVSDTDRGIGESSVDCFEAKRFSGKGTGKHIEYEDDLVRVYDKSGTEIYSGLEDYEPMKDENWHFDKSLGAYRFEDYIKVCV